MTKTLQDAFTVVSAEVERVKPTKVGKSQYKELRNFLIEITEPEPWLPKETVLSHKFLEKEWSFRLGEIDESPEHPYTGKHRFEYADVGKRLQKVLRVLRWKRAPMSAILLVLNPDNKKIEGEKKREMGHLPCTAGYNLTVRDGKLLTTVMMRSNTFPEMFLSDVNLAIKLHLYSAEKLKLEPGPLTYFSMRTYRKLSKSEIKKLCRTES
mgnify:CR=1 FL=1